MNGLYQAWREEVKARNYFSIVFASILIAIVAPFYYSAWIIIKLICLIVTLVKKGTK